MAKGKAGKLVKAKKAAKLPQYDSDNESLFFNNVINQVRKKNKLKRKVKCFFYVQCLHTEVTIRDTFR